MNKRTLFPILLVPTVIVLIPLTAMLLNADGWAWSVADFVIAWVCIASVLLAYRLVARKATTRAYRAAMGITLGTHLLLFWINGAVGLIGNENNPANLLYLGVLGVSVMGAAIARLAPLGMARTLFATAAAQFLVPVIAVIIWRPDFSPGVVQVFVLNFVFVLLFAGAALLFRHTRNISRSTGRPPST